MIFAPLPGDDDPLEGDISTAEAHLVACHPGFAPLVAAHGPCRLRGRRDPAETHLEALAASICYQQLAGAAAAAIWARVRALGPGGFDAATVAGLDPTELRAAGLSGAKAASLADLSRRVLDGVLDLDAVGDLDDEDAIAALSGVRGIGRWTAQMFLLFRLRRLDIWPTGDLGVRRGYARILDLPAAPDSKELDAMGDPLRPWRSVAAWYCWRAADGPAPGST